MPKLVLENVRYTQDSEEFIYDFSAQFNSGINLLIGPTTAGKTTLMRLIAGLVTPTAGSISLDGRDLIKVPVRERSVAFVYQQFINYPSLTVFQNIASPLNATKNKPSKQEIKNRVEQVAELLGLTPFLKRKPSELSGGQQQRVAIARALSRKADIVLLDEPLANLDYKLREQLRSELQSIFSNDSSVVIYSTAEPSEALDFATDSFVMNEGSLIQSGKALGIYQRPVSISAAIAMSDPPINLVRSKVDGSGATFGNSVFKLSRSDVNISAAEITLGIQPGKIVLESSPTANIPINCKVILAELTGSSTFVHVTIDSGEQLVIEIEGSLSFDPDQSLTAYFNPADLYGFDSVSEKALFFPVGGGSNG
jgi:glycerol transport system ATP-binding protein